LKQESFVLKTGINKDFSEISHWNPLKF